MAEHTPTPWFKNSKFEVGPRPRTDDQHDGMLHAIADVFGDNREADAAFIVKAVNNHETLVNALTRARDAVMAIVLSTHSISFDADLRAIDLALEGCGALVGSEKVSGK